MRKRWFIYIIIGIIFGVFDFYYQEVTQVFITSIISWFLIAWAIWLVPIVPVALYEAKVSMSKRMACLASVITWSISIISYYLFIMVKYIFIGQSTRIGLHFSNYGDEFYWSNLKAVFLNEVLSGIAEWIIVAIVGGLTVGFFVSFIYLHFKKTI